MWIGRMGERGEGTVSGRGRWGGGGRGEKGIERGRDGVTENGVLRGFVCVCVLYFSLSVKVMCIMGD